MKRKTAPRPSAGGAGALPGSVRGARALASAGQHDGAIACCTALLAEGSLAISKLLAEDNVVNQKLAMRLLLVPRRTTD